MEDARGLSDPDPSSDNGATAPSGVGEATSAAATPSLGTQTPTRVRRATGGIVVVAVAGVVVVGGVVFAAARHAAASAEVRAASAEIHSGDYTEAAASLITARATWPWADVATEQTQAAALIASSAAYQQGQQDMTSAKYPQAITAFSKVLSGDIHYTDAQKQLTNLQQATNDAQLLGSVITDGQHFDTDMTTFWANYNAAIASLNAAWHGLGAEDVTSFLTAAGPRVAGLSSGAVGNDVAALSTDMGAVRSASLDAQDLQRALTAYQDASVQVTTVANALSDEASVMNNGGFLAALDEVPGDIDTGNTAESTLEADEQQGDQMTAQFVGYAMATIKTLLGTQDISSLVSGQGQITRSQGSATM